MTQLLDKPTDQRIVLQGTWEQFKLIQQASQDSPGVKLFFYEGTIEVLMPGFQHENFSEIIGYLVTTFLLSQGITFVPSGSVTQEREGKASAQADKSYCLGGAKPIPDLSIEVIFTSGSSNKLARYEALGVSEVWFWQDGVLTLHHLRNEGYEQIGGSELPGLEQLDVDLLRRCILMAETDFPLAVQTFQASIGRR
ncbi:Uma2 family endonuclease [Funiculus sociatus GB2-M2]|uniref:Uma2 family endonuclease n=1 Tax=Funiculus sociatus TaxID=450527 RepID=UPI003296900E